MKTTHKTRDQFARIICVNCHAFSEDNPVDEVSYLSIAEYERQMLDPNRGWRCLACGCYPCEFDDEYFELPLA